MFSLFVLPKMMAESRRVRLPLTTLRGFFSNEETAQNFLYPSATISFSCKHDTYVDFVLNQPKIRLFFTRFQGLGTPRASCRLNYVLHPCNVYKLICITKYQFFIHYTLSILAKSSCFCSEKSSTKVIAALVRPQLQRWSNPVPQLRRFEPIKGCRLSLTDIASS